MDWLHSYKSLRSHPKTRKLARRVGGIVPAIGHLHCLWWWALDYAPDGDLTKHDAEDIAIACEWDGDPEEIVSALVACGFLENGDGLHIHDAHEYIGKYIEKAGEKAENMRKYRDRSGNVDTTCTPRGGNVPVTPSRAKIEREIERKKRAGAHESAPPPAVSSVDNSAERVCWRCGHVISGDEVLDDLCVISNLGIRHRECAA